MDHKTLVGFGVNRLRNKSPPTLRFNFFFF